MSGEDFAGYRLVQRLGSGASGTVFAAEQGAHRRPVAIKILHPHLVGDGEAERMLAEAHTLSLLDHPGIVKVFDMGVAAGGRVYVVMEHLEGEPLHARLRRARLSEPRVVAFARQLASALEVAHGAGVVHRDLKPENVLVVADPELPGGERVKLIDFGIAKREGLERTATGVVLGTPAYMAPEQFLGSRHADPRADVYSLGVVIYLMATGTPPFSGRDTGELLAEHAFCRPTPASELGVSRSLSAIIERCLAKRPGDRFETMGQLGAALRALEAAPAATAAAAAAAAAARQFDDARTSVWSAHDEVTTPAATRPAKLRAKPSAEPRAELHAKPPARPATLAPPPRAPQPTVPLPPPRPATVHLARRSRRRPVLVIAAAAAAIALVSLAVPAIAAPVEEAARARSAARAAPAAAPIAPAPEAPGARGRAILLGGRF